MNSAELSLWLAKLHREVQQTNSQFPKNLVTGWPIPFFGDILHARVLTVGVNPSDKEFSPHRRWHEVNDAARWQNRLLTYFQNSEVRPWIWFETWSMCLTMLAVGYAGGGAAHIDISPRPTTPMLHKDSDKPEFRRMVENDAKWFFELLAKLPKVQLLLVAGPIPRADGTQQQLADFICKMAGKHGAMWIRGEPLPKLVVAGHPKGVPVLICPFAPEVDGRYAMVRHVHRNRDSLLPLAAPGINAVPIVPGRLDWPSAIGSFLLSFGMLEYFVFVFLKDRLSETDFEKMKECHLNDRLARIAKYLKDEGAQPLERSNFEALLKRIGPIRELRNHIAHGHMNVRFDPRTTELKVTIMKAKDVDGALLTGTRYLDFEELRSALQTIAQINREFERLAGFKPEDNATRPSEHTPLA